MAASKSSKIIKLSGRVRNGRLVVPRRLKLADGSVMVSVSPVNGHKSKSRGLSFKQLTSSSVFGIWKDRKDMEDVSAYVKQLRDHEETRSSRGR